MKWCVCMCAIDFFFWSSWSAHAWRIDPLRLRRLLLSNKIHSKRVRAFNILVFGAVFLLFFVAVVSLLLFCVCSCCCCCCCWCRCWSLLRSPSLCSVFVLIDKTSFRSDFIKLFREKWDHFESWFCKIFIKKMPEVCWSERRRSQSGRHTYTQRTSRTYIRSNNDHTMNDAIEDRFTYV